MNIIMVQSNTRIYMHGAFRAGIQSHMIRVRMGRSYTGIYSYAYIGQLHSTHFALICSSAVRLIIVLPPGSTTGLLAAQSKCMTSHAATLAIYTVYSYHAVLILFYLLINKTPKGY